MDVIFKIAGVMFLIVIGLIIIVALVNSWSDITDSISGTFSDHAEEKNRRQKAEAEKFRNQVITILEHKGRYDPESEQQVYIDSKIAIHGTKKITWRTKTKNPMEDCEKYIEALYRSCSNEISSRLQASEKIYEKASRIITYLGDDEEHQSGALFLCRDDRSSNIKIYLNEHLVFSKSDFRDPSSLKAYRTGKWEQDLTELDRDARSRKLAEEQERASAENLKRVKSDKEKFINFSPIDEE